VSAPGATAEVEARGRSADAACARVLVVDDDPIVADSLTEFLRVEGHEAATAFNAGEALAMLEQADSTRPFEIVIADVSMPGMDGVEMLKEIQRREMGAVVLMLTAYGTIESAVDAIKLGAADYMTKPVVDSELRLSLERALRQSRLVVENRVLKSQLEGRYGLDSIVGADHRMVKIYDLVEAVAPSRTTVLITGESGSGKSMLARAIHQRSPRRDRPFVEISCGSIPDTLLESELFGHVRGAFTGAHADKEGKFLAADGGTIFLDEINSASPGMQVKLLRVLQERRFEPVGSTQTREVDVRVVLASNERLDRLVAEGRFRQDLYYRINVVWLDLPPLRDRAGDVPRLVEHFVDVHAREAGKQVAGVSAEAMEALRRYAWPGNVRELSNALERAVILTQRQTIELSDLPATVASNDPGALAPGGGASPGTGGADDPMTPWAPIDLHEALKDPERRIILKALKANDWNRQQTADDLGINRTTLYKKMKTLGLDGPGV